MSNSEAVARDEFFDSLLGDFLDESGQLLDQLNENLLQLDDWVRSLDDDHNEHCDDELMNEMFRSAHSLKGLSAMLGLDEINNLTHKVENVFDAARKDELSFTGDCVDLMFQSVDRLVALVDVLKEPDGETVECGPVLEGIQELLENTGAERAQSSQADAERVLADSMAELGGTKSPQPPESSDVKAESAPPPAAEAESDPGTDDVVPPVDHFQDLENESEVPAKYLSIFIDETDLSLDSLTETLLALEGGGNSEEIKSLLIISHRIKGSAASIGLNRAAKLAHLMEDLLQDLVEREGTLSAELTDAMLRCTDGLRSFVEELKKGNTGSDQFRELAAGLQAAQRTASAKPETHVDPVETPSQTAQASEAEPQVATVPAVVATVPTVEIDETLRANVAKVTPAAMISIVGRVLFQPSLPLVGLKARLIYEKLSNLGDVCYFDPPAETIDEIDCLDVLSFGVVTEQPEEAVRQQLRISGVADATVATTETTSAEATPSVEPASTSTVSDVPKSVVNDTRQDLAANTNTPRAADAGSNRQAAARKKRPAADTANKPTETLRVDIDRLDHLMNLAGQLVISKARFAQIDDRMKKTLGGKKSVQVLGDVFGMLDKMASGTTDNETDKGNLLTELDLLRSQAHRIQSELESVRRDVDAMMSMRTSANELGEAIHQLGRVSDGIQQSVMDTRMVPIGPLFGRFKRVVRDITRSNGKNIRLVINGEKTELDKRMIDELSDPLIHMVRNSADHGVELPEDRLAAGKSEEGTVTLDAYHRGNSIVIAVTDDGKGLDHDGILRKALEKGLVSEADKLTPQQVYQLIWEPGLTTAKVVTEVSGRGMGMDIVRSKIEEINGVVDVDSTPGEGTRFTIKLPLTLAILPSLMVQIKGDVFAMPMESVVEIVGVRSKDLATVHGLWTASVRGRVISMVDLRDLLSWNPTSADDDAGRNTEKTLVILGEAGQELGLQVDGILGEENVVVKSMAENYQNVPGIAGASILGDGRVSLILDVPALIAMSSNQATTGVS